MKKIKVLFALLLTVVLAFSAYAPSAQAADKVKVTFWHAMNGPHAEELTKLVKAFNESQDKYEVEETSQGNYKALQQVYPDCVLAKIFPTSITLSKPCSSTIFIMLVWSASVFSPSSSISPSISVL